MPVNTQKYNIDVNKLALPLAKSWIFFLQTNKSNSSPTKKAKAILQLLESVVCYTNMALIANYVAYPKHHKKDIHTLIYKYLTEKKNWVDNAISCIDKVWPKENTFLNFKSLNKTVLVKTFRSVLTSDYKKNKKPTQKQTKEFAKGLEKIIPLMNLWSNYPLIYYQDYPWQNVLEVTSPILLFTGLSPVSSLQSISTDIHGTLKQFYLFDINRSKILSLSPLVFTENPEENMYLFFRFQKKTGKALYLDVFHNKNYSIPASQKIKSFCKYLKTSFIQAPIKITEQNIKAKNLYLPLEKVDTYPKIQLRIERILSSKRFNLLTSLQELLIKFFINAIIKKIKTPELIRIFTAINLGKKCMHLSRHNDETVSKDILWALEDIKNSEIMSNSFFRSVWNELENQKDYSNLVSFIRIWCFYDIERAKKQFLLMPEEYKDDAFAVILRYLFVEEMYKEIISFFDFVCKEEGKTFVMSKETILYLVRSFIKEKHEKCFSICQKFSQSWNLDWIDELVEELLDLSITNTIQLINTCGFYDEKNYNNQKWQKWLLVYHSLVKDKENFQQLVNGIKEPLAKIRISGVAALEQDNIELFTKTVSDITFSNNLEHIIYSLCFFIDHIEMYTPHHHDLTLKLIESVRTYTHSLMDMVGAYHIKNDIDKFTGSIHSGSVMKLYNDVKQENANVSIFEVFISYLASHNIIQLDNIKNIVEIIQQKSVSMLSQETEISTELVDFFESLPENSKNDYNMINQLLAEVAKVFWVRDKSLAVLYISQMIPDILFDKEDAVKALINKNSGITYKDLDLFQFEKYELERIQSFWIDRHIRQFPQNILSLYFKVDEAMKRRLIEKGIPILMKFNMDEAIKFINLLGRDITFDFGEDSGKIFLDFYRHDPVSGKNFLQKINTWDLSHNVDVSTSLLRSFRKLPFNKLFDLYKKIVGNTDNFVSEEICTLLLSAIVVRKPSVSFSLLKNLSLQISDKLTEKIMCNLVYQLCKSNNNLGKSLFIPFFQKIQMQEFAIDVETLVEIEDSIANCITEKTFSDFLPEIYLHKWIVIPRLFVKICYQLLHYNPEQSIQLLSYMVGKKEIFLFFGEPALQITHEKDFDFVLQFTKYKQGTLKPIYKKAILNLLVKSISRYSAKSISSILPYLLHPIWSRNEIVLMRDALPKEIDKKLSVTNYLIYIVLCEMGDFQRARFESNFKGFIEKYYRNDTEKIDIEKHFFPIIFRMMFFIDKSFIDEIWSAYWDQMDFIANLFIHAIEDPKLQIEWVGKILNNEDRIEVLETIATNIVDQELPEVNGFIEECIQAIDMNGGLEYLFLRIPNIFIVLIESDIEMTISLINRIFDEEIQTSALEFALEYLSTTKNLSKKMCKRIMPWLCYTDISQNIEKNDLLYFYCQLAERMWEIDCIQEAKKVTQEIIKLAKMCEEREKKYYLEDLAHVLVSKDVSLASQVVMSYEDNKVSFCEVVIAQSTIDMEKAIKMARQHPSQEVVYSTLIELACFHAGNDSQTSLAILKLPELDNIEYNVILHVKAIIAAQQKQNPEKYTARIKDQNQLLETYTYILKIYNEKKCHTEVVYYQQKIKKMIYSIQPSYTFLGLSLEWSNGFAIDISNKTLHRISLLYPECAIKLFHMYSEHDRFIDLDEVLQVILKNIIETCPDSVMEMLQKVNYFDFSPFLDVIKEEVKKNPVRVMSWFIQQEQSHLYDVVLNEVQDENVFAKCLNMALETNKSLSKDEYIAKLNTLVKHIFRLGGPFILFQIMSTIKAFSLPQQNISLRDLLQLFVDICKKWEEKEKEKLKIRE